VILVDTSVWIRHFATTEPRLAGLLEDGQVMVHPFVIGELACGTLRKRQEILSLLDRLDSVAVASDGETRRLIERRRLMGRGLGWVDVHLLASCLLAGVPLWSLDRRLVRVAEMLELSV
jgi:predicted nucleic acid-binding protein